MGRHDVGSNLQHARRRGVLRRGRPGFIKSRNGLRDTQTPRPFSGLSSPWKLLLCASPADSSSSGQHQHQQSRAEQSKAWLLARLLSFLTEEEKEQEKER